MKLKKIAIGCLLSLLMLPSCSISKDDYHSKPDNRYDYHDKHQNSRYDKPNKYHDNKYTHHDRYDKHYYPKVNYHTSNYHTSYKIKHHKPISSIVGISVVVGSMAYIFSDGYFYRPYNGGYVIAQPPIGAIVPSLPYYGYTTMLIGGRKFYYYENIYYVWDDYYRGYKVVESPYIEAQLPSLPTLPEPAPAQTNSEYKAGDIVTKLPNGAVAVQIDGKQYYKYGEVYFLPSAQKDGIVYIVVNVKR
ncbi:MAG: hypothetical protein HXX81_05145 [Campylobacterales bacterium]|nr:hypothetical protein [Campylobacterales bacterium]